MKNIKPATRILIIGLDGASPHLIQQWRAHLPHLSSLMETGSSGILESVIPPRSIPAWYCFATGMNPAKLGVFGFSQRLPGRYDYTFANLSYCRAPAFWQWLNQNGIQTAIVHVPGTYPPHPVEGVMVSGWPAPLNRAGLVYTHPPELSREIDAELGQPFEFLSAKPMRVDNDAEMLQERLRIVAMHGQVARKVLTESEWQVGVVVFSALDRASHQFWRHLDPTHPAHDPQLAPEFDSALRQVYQACDAEVGQLLALLGEQDSVLIISDHGFGPARRVFYLNEWLKSQGYLVMQDTAAASQRKSSWLGRLAKPLFWLNRSSPLFRRLVAPFKKRTLSNYIRDEYVLARDAGLARLNHLPVDWTRTRAYCPDEGALYLNLKGRDPQGIVAPGIQAEALLAEIMDKLQQVPDPATGQPVPVELWRKEAVYSGPYLDQAPELTIAMDGFATEVMAELGAGLWAETPARSGTHTLDGLLIAAGAQIQPGVPVQAGLMDIAPTALHLAGLPVLQAMDGRVLQELLHPQPEAGGRPVEQVDLPVGELGEIKAYSDQEQAQVEDRLRDLGYLG